MNSKLYNLKVKPSKIDGKGLFSFSEIPKRKKIGELSGEIISISKARKISKLKKRIAIVELDYNYALDASNTDTKFKFINHSCNPNTYMRIINHRVEFYSLKKISILQELTCNYGETHHEGKLKCNCKEKNCNKYI